jgi:hypothetical protein
MTFDVSDLRLLYASNFRGGNKSQWDRWSDGGHRGKNCHEVFLLPLIFARTDSDPRSVHVRTPLGERSQVVSLQLMMRDSGTV